MTTAPIGSVLLLLDIVMPSRILFPLKSSFYRLSLRAGSTLVATGDGLLSLVRMILVIMQLQMFENEHRLIKMDMHESKIRFSVLFGINMLTCVLLGVGILVSERRPWPVLMVPWLVMFLSCTWLYYPNIIFHKKQPLPIIICVLVMVICLYCYCVVLSLFLEVLERSTRKPLASDLTSAVV